MSKGKIVLEIDPLTGLEDAGCLERVFLPDNPCVSEDGPRSCIVVDIDHLTLMNDYWGKPMGDQAIKLIAGLLQEHLGPHDTAVYLGGGGFLVVQPSAPLAAAWIWARRLHQMIRGIIVRVSGLATQITVSVGVVTSETESICGDMLTMAKQALCLAKDQGRDRVCTWEMVEVQQAIDDLGADQTKDLQQRCLGFFERFFSRIGPTQREHLSIHANQVSEMAGRIARQMGLDSRYTDQIINAAALHDIGKCIIPERLLAKRGSLVVEEWQLMSLHARLGAWIASGLGVNDQIVEMIHHHHTRYDSYDPLIHLEHPSCLGARVLCVADALVTMMTDRAYRPAQPVGVAMNELRRERGRQFDPRVVDAACALPAEWLTRAA